jgi:CheY-like chemotaxis protein
MRALHILLVEDDQFKQEPLESAIREIYADAVIDVARSVQQAVKSLRSREFDFITLDIALPSHESRAGSAQPISQPSGGIEVLLELAYDERKDPVIIVTQYPDIEYNGKIFSLSRARQALSVALPVNLLAVIQFSPQDHDWHEQFRKAMACER